ncbi:MAG: histidine phosphatase family protein [Candidatus Obscuribacterales bacterium]|nr:histidine phosphatase family protein [Candidatus Obscuribacterales bacterium]
MSDELHPPETITRFYLIRHGHTEPTELGKLYSDPAVALTEKGMEQSKAVGRWLKEEQPDVLLSSTAFRVLSTAELIESQTGLKNQPVEDLNEWSVGEWEGRTYLDIKKNDPEIYQAWVADPISNAPPGGESVIDLCQRINRRLADVIKSHEGKSIALVTHAGVIRAILTKAIGAPVRNFWRLAIPVGSISRVDISESFATIYFTSFTPPQ